MAKKLSKEKAKKWADKFKKDGKGAHSVNFKVESVYSILNQKDCKGLRIYNAFDEEKNQYTMFLVGTDEKGNNLLPENLELSNESYSIEDDGLPCPPDCPEDDL